MSVTRQQFTVSLVDVNRIGAIVVIIDSTSGSMAAKTALEKVESEHPNTEWMVVSVFEGKHVSVMVNKPSK